MKSLLSHPFSQSDHSTDHPIQSLYYLKFRITLESADGSGEPQGKIRLKISLLRVSNNIEDAANGGDYSAILSVFLDSVQTRPIYSDVPEVSVMMFVDESDFAETEIVLGRDPVFQEGHIFMLKKIESEKLHFKIMDMAEDDDSVIHFIRLKSIIICSDAVVQCYSIAVL